MVSLVHIVIVNKYPLITSLKEKQSYDHNKMNNSLALNQYNLICILQMCEGFIIRLFTIIILPGFSCYKFK